MRGKEVTMNKKLIIMLGVATIMAGGAFARGWHGRPHHGWHPRPVHHHHCHGRYWGRGGCHFWPGFVGGVVGGALTRTIIDTSPPVVVQQPAVVTQPVVVQQPAPVVVQQPAPVVVQQPQQVWVEGRYVDQVQANGSTVRIWQPGHYEQR
jgi:hypothetical protein